MPGMMASAESPSTSPVAPAVSPAPLDPEQLRTALQTQLEFYFSRQNLETDSYLLSQMDESRYVSIAVIQEFKMVKKLTEDADLIVEMMRRSKLLELNSDGTKVRPTNKAERTTIILRDIPSNTPVEELRAIFDNDQCANVLSLRSDIANTWFVTFEDEDSCLKTAMYLRQQSFQGKLIRLCVKSENLTRSFYQQPPPAVISVAGNVQWSGPPPAGYFPGVMYQRRQTFPQQPPQMTRDPSGMMPPLGPRHMSGPPPGWNRAERVPAFWSADGVPMFAAGPAMMGFGQHGIPGEYGKPERRGSRSDSRKKVGGRKGGNGRQNRKSKKFSGPRKNDGSHHHGADADSTERQPNPDSLQLGPEHFPALPSTKTSGGYQAPFTTYSREQMSSIVKGLAPQTSMPESMQVEAECSVVQDEPVKETQLLKPFPVFYPGSPSPLLAAQMSRSVPDLDLDADLPTPGNNSKEGECPSSLSDAATLTNSGASPSPSPQHPSPEPVPVSVTDAPIKEPESVLAPEPSSDSSSPVRGEAGASVGPGGHSSLTPDIPASSKENVASQPSAVSSPADSHQPLKPISYAEIARRSKAASASTEQTPCADEN